MLDSAFEVGDRGLALVGVCHGQHDLDARIVGTYSCQHPSNVTYSQIAKAAFEAFGTRGNVSFLLDKPDIPDNVFAADDALYEAIGFRPSTTIEDGLRRIARQS